MRLKLLKLVSPLLAFFMFSPLLHLHPPSSVFLKKSGLHYSDGCHSGHGQLKPPSATHGTADNSVQSSSGSGSRPVMLKERRQDTVSLLLLSEDLQTFSWQKPALKCRFLQAAVKNFCIEFTAFNASGGRRTDLISELLQDGAAATVT